MQNSFRWYGPHDPVSLSDIRQSNADFIVTLLHHIPYGKKWSKNEIQKSTNFINKHNSKKYKHDGMLLRVFRVHRQQH